MTFSCVCQFWQTIKNPNTKSSIYPAKLAAPASVCSSSSSVSTMGFWRDLLTCSGAAMSSRLCACIAAELSNITKHCHTQPGNPNTLRKCHYNTASGSMTHVLGLKAAACHYESVSVYETLSRAPTRILRHAQRTQVLPPFSSVLFSGRSLCFLSGELIRHCGIELIRDAV
jgi:hypothetical protein